MDNIYVKRNGLTNHWGIWVDPNIPITGVLSNNSASQFIFESIAYEDGINLEFESHLESSDHSEDNCETCEYWEDYNSTYLIGNWIKDNNGLYDYDPDGEYAAIVGEIYTQVVYSKYTKKVKLCSPCYPGQGDLDSSGEYLAYTLPSEAFEY
jgi:hypothetical protein